MDENQRESIEKEQRDGVSAHVENENEKLSRVEIWKDFQPDKVSEAMLQNAIQKTDSFPTDEQSRRFAQFLSIATCFSSIPYAEKLHKVPELVESIKLLLQNMIAEVKEYSDMASELETLIKFFTRMVRSVQHNVNLMLPLLKTADNQINVIDDAMNSQQNQKKLNEEDKKDIQLALSRMSSGIEKLLTIAESARNESREIDMKILLMTNSVQAKKITVLNRLDIVNICLGFSIPVSAATFGAATGGIIAAEGFGGVGALTIAGMAFPPTTAMICAIILGGSCALTAVYLVKKFWASRQLKALGYLNKIFESLVQLNTANDKFLCYISDAKEKANVVKEHMQDIQLCLESERQWKNNQDICAKATESTKAMIDSLQKISSLDISQLTTTNFLALKSEK